jgi:flagellar biosynthetic protein FliR
VTDLQFEPGVLPAFGLYLLRTSALVLSTPILGQLTGFSGYKIALIFGIAFLLFGVTGTPIPEAAAPIAFCVFALREVLIGLFLGFLVQLAVLAVRVAGAMVGHEMGFAMAQQVDPETGVQVPLITRIYENLFLLGLLMVDGHHWLLRAFAASFERAPAGRIGLGPGVGGAVVEIFGEMFRAGLSFAAPVMVLLVMVSILIGLLSRAVPQLNVLEVGFSVRIGLALVSMCLFAPLLAPAMELVHDQLDRGLAGALDVLEI